MAAHQISGLPGARQSRLLHPENVCCLPISNPTSACVSGRVYRHFILIFDPSFRFRERNIQLGATSADTIVQQSSRLLGVDDVKALVLDKVTTPPCPWLAPLTQSYYARSLLVPFPSQKSFGIFPSIDGYHFLMKQLKVSSEDCNGCLFSSHRPRV